MFRITIRINWLDIIKADLKVISIILIKNVSYKKIQHFKMSDAAAKKIIWLFLVKTGLFVQNDSATLYKYVHK